MSTLLDVIACEENPSTSLPLLPKPDLSVYHIGCSPFGVLYYISFLNTLEVFLWGSIPLLDLKMAAVPVPNQV